MRQGLTDAPSARGGVPTRVVVDIGAWDGMMSSNSFNLIQSGWDGLIVEPYEPNMAKAKGHLQRYASSPPRSLLLSSRLDQWIHTSGAGECCC